MLLRTVEAPASPAGVPRPATTARGRRAAAALEFAVIAPVLIALLFAALELGRAVLSLELLSHAARNGARTGSLTHRSTADVRSATRSALQSAGLDPDQATVTVKVNGTVKEVSTAEAGADIEVTVAMPFSRLTWLPTTWFLGNTSLSEAVVMRRE
jgi:Flp pilus assembly protein TadG